MKKDVYVGDPTEYNCIGKATLPPSNTTVQRSFVFHFGFYVHFIVLLLSLL